MADNISCECGSIVNKKNYKKHILTKKHLNGSGLIDLIHGKNIGEGKNDFKKHLDDWSSNGQMIHIVKINKRLGKEEADEIASKLSNSKKKLHYSSLKNHHKYRSTPRSKFVAGSLVTQKLDKDVSVIVGKGFFKDMFNKVVSKVKDVFTPTTTHVEQVKSGSLVPSTKVLYEMAENSYQNEPRQIDQYQLILKSPYLSAYRDDKTVILAVRGTDISDMKDLMADISIALGQLRSSQRYKSDIIEINKLKQEPELSHLYWIGTGHSLGGALIDEFLKQGLISEAVTFNPAVSREFYNVDNHNRRIYMSRDPLYLMMGKNTKYHEVRDRPDVGIMKAHSISNFVGGSRFDKRLC